MYIVTSLAFYISIIAAFVLFNRRSYFFKRENLIFGKRDSYITWIVCIITIVIMQIPMGLSPAWNGELKNHHDQYERLADSMIKGHLYLDFEDGVDPKLLSLDNPYDPAKREENDVDFHWDSAFYNGKYYMYFGVVPVILLFIPFKLITGLTLPTIMATRIFLAFFVFGIFSLFKLLSRKFFKTLPLALTILMSISMSVLSSWYILDAPELYCTAISAGMAAAIWSIYFYIRAVFVQKENNKVIKDAFIASIFGAIIWGCRPTIGLICIAIIPFVIVYVKNYLMGEYFSKGGYLKQQQVSGGKLYLVCVRNLIIAAIPYLLIGGLLMIYNYLRFDNPFEFGQSYQLTVADQSAYASFFEEFDLIAVINGLAYNFIKFRELSYEFPFVKFQGVFLEFPVLLITFAIFFRRVGLWLKKDKLLGFVIALNIIPVLITVVSVVWTPNLLERYKLDFLFIMAINTFIITGELNKTTRIEDKNKFREFVAYLCILAILVAFLLFIYPYGSNFTQYSPELLREIAKALSFGIK